MISEREKNPGLITNVSLVEFPFHISRMTYEEYLSPGTKNTMNDQINKEIKHNFFNLPGTTTLEDYI